MYTVLLNTREINIARLKLYKRIRLSNILAIKKYSINSEHEPKKAIKKVMNELLEKSLLSNTKDYLLIIKINKHISKTTRNRETN